MLAAAKVMSEMSKVESSILKTKSMYKQLLSNKFYTINLSLLLNV